ncbi:MAG: hypothetical protein COB04_09230 [Gammaproteobacteria bacterium]|nr:MAG: hypothetical protein COB04_09230 [Gammaproteobacteria bacterium]
MNIGRFGFFAKAALVFVAVGFSWGCSDSSAVQELVVSEKAVDGVASPVAAELGGEVAEAKVEGVKVEPVVAEVRLPLVLQIDQSGSVAVLGADGLPKVSLAAEGAVSAVVANTKTITLLDLAETNQVMVCIDGACNVYANDLVPAS